MSTSGPAYEIREIDSDEIDLPLDEVVARYPNLVHLERMSKTGWWLGIDMADGTHIAVNLGTENDEGKPYAFAEVENP